MFDKKIVGVVVFYNPSKSHFLNVKKNSRVLDHIVLVINGEYTEDLSCFDSFSNVTILVEGYNTGIGKATNDGVRKAIQLAIARNVVFLDQDTLLPANYKKIIQIRDLIEATGQRVGIVAPTYRNPRTNTVSYALIFRKFTFRRFIPKGAYFESTCPIASGSLIALELFMHVGFLDEDMFIDYVDNDFALRLCSKGFKNYVIPDICMDHELGEQTIHHFLGLTFRPTNHSIFRKYYITRNRLLVLKRYGLMYPSLFLFEFLAVTLDIFRIAAFEKERAKKFKAIYLGTYDFLRSRYGIRKF